MKTFPTFIEWIIKNQNRFNKDEAITVLNHHYNSEKKEFEKDIYDGVKLMKLYDYRELEHSTDILLSSAYNTIATIINKSLKNGTMKQIAYEHSPEDDSITNDIMQTIEKHILKPFQSLIDNKDSPNIMCECGCYRKAMNAHLMNMVNKVLDK